MPPTHRMTAAKAVVESLRRLGLDTVFGLPGVHNLPLYDALHGAPDIRHVLARNESGAAFMADGYARASGRPAALFTITGPGVLNAMTGVAEAHAASSPILWIATEIPAHTRNEGKRGALHELDDQMALTQTVTRFQCRVEDPGAVPSALAVAWHHLSRGRRGPVYVEIPLDVLDQEGEVSFPDPRPPGEKGGRGIDEAAVRGAADLLRAAERPVFVIGGGAAWAEARASSPKTIPCSWEASGATPGTGGNRSGGHWKRATSASPSERASAPPRPTGGRSACPSGSSG